MDLKAERIREHLADSSRILADLTASMVYDNPALLKSLVEVSLSSGDPHAHRAARVVTICCLEFPEMLKPVSRMIISKLEGLRSYSVLRNYLKLYAEVPVNLSAREKAILMNGCFGYLTDSKVPVAVKVFSMEILNNLSAEFPDIGRELYNIVEDQYDDGTPGFKSRARKILRK